MSVKWLAFIYRLTLILHQASAEATVTFSYQKNCLSIKSDKSLYLAKASIMEMKKPGKLEILLH